ncbi:deleted in malignant brain tumors 1 protein-like [Microcaecilia unicolor]|uniref:Deleted in malignant brain tumors 1 protein-like n=1 Tax=Microcaecilia unicolor TaxID=1415580 RepID=A0A6P7YCK6_9AMPH|nr:deleted in malignant brain tumors 1 protein-like [Microcaecilia unicolor]
MISDKKSNAVIFTLRICYAGDEQQQLPEYCYDPHADEVSSQAQERSSLIHIDTPVMGCTWSHDQPSPIRQILMKERPFAEASLEQGYSRSWERGSVSLILYSWNTASHDALGRQMPAGKGRDFMGMGAIGKLWGLLFFTTSIAYGQVAQPGVPQLPALRPSLNSMPNLRLVGGADRCRGRVEVHYNGVWGTVCDNLWDRIDALVVCRQLRCGVALSAPGNAFFGQGRGRIILNNVQCGGNEAHLWQCPNSGSFSSACSHAEDAGVECSDQPQALRLANGEDQCRGRVEVYYNGVWGTVCDIGWDLTDAQVVCRQLGCGSALSAPGNAYYGQGTGSVLLDSVQCTGSEPYLWQCFNGGWATSVCRHSRDASAVCSDQPQALRLANGEDQCKGRVEVYYNGVWGTVCDIGWDLTDAQVVCRQLGCGSALSAPGNAYYGQGTGSVLLDSVQCTGSEPSLWQCFNGGWATSVCSHVRDASAVCSDMQEVFLAVEIKGGLIRGYLLSEVSLQVL